MNGNCFDEESDGDIHGECAAEIHSLQAKIAILRGALDLASTELYCHVDCGHCDVGVEPEILIAVQKALHATTPDYIADAGKKVEQEKSAAVATYASERALMVAQIGDCCGGGDPLCGGGCLVQKALMRNSAAPAQPIETRPTYRNIEAKRLRRLCALVGLSNAIPETDSELHDCMFSVLGMICRKVEAAAEQAKTAPHGWIAISDRLPEYEVMVVLLDENTTIATGSDYGPYHATCGYLRNSSTQDYWSIPYRSGVDSTAFTHWMPLPEYPS